MKIALERKARGVLVVKVYLNATAVLKKNMMIELNALISKQDALTDRRASVKKIKIKTGIA